MQFFVSFYLIFFLLQDNAFGQLGRDGTTDLAKNANEITTLDFIAFTASLNALSIVGAAVSDHSCALFQTGTLACWGRNDYGQLGSTASTATNLGSAPTHMVNLVPIAFSVTQSVVQVSAGGTSTCALFSHGRIICFGRGDFGVLGTDGTASVGASGTIAAHPLIIFSDSLPAIFIDVGGDHACAIFSNQKLRCWGRGTNAQLGDTTLVSKGDAAGASSVTNASYVSFAATIDSFPIIMVSAGQ